MPDTTEPDDPQSRRALNLAQDVTVWATPASMPDPSGRGLLPLLFVVSSITAVTWDDHRYADTVDVIAAALLADGFALVPTFDPPHLDGVPQAATWRAQLATATAHLQITEPRGLFYDGDLPNVADSWVASARAAAAIVVISLRMPEAGTHIDPAILEPACQAGQVIAARVPFTAT